jgi:hypothetical protein
MSQNGWSLIREHPAADPPGCVALSALQHDPREDAADAGLGDRNKVSPVQCYGYQRSGLI